MSGSKVTAILAKGLILPNGGASAVKDLQSTGLLRLVLKDFSQIKGFFSSFLFPFKDSWFFSQQLLERK